MVIFHVIDEDGNVVVSAGEGRDARVITMGSWAQVLAAVAPALHARVFVRMWIDEEGL